jgi:hypothetical protein
MDRFEKIKQLRDEHETALDEADRLRDAYHREIVKLHRSGLSLREIADELGISHQRVHQIVAPHEEEPRSRSKRGVVAGVVAAVLVLGGALLIAHHRPSQASSAMMVRVSQSQPSAVAVRCKPSRTGHRSSFSPLQMAAACGGDVVRNGIQPTGIQPTGRRGTILIIDPKTGKVLGTRSTLVPPPQPLPVPAGVPVPSR